VAPAAADHNWTQYTPAAPYESSVWVCDTKIERREKLKENR
jgi:hypothetical protein